MQPRRTAYHHQIHWPVHEEGIEVIERFSTVLAAEPLYLFAIRTKDRGNLHTGNRARRASVSLRDVAAAN
jgi:hypothetical protein